ncbi:MAG: CBS domain-containing protein [Bacteroidales bacterium]|nr:CBS domain-containing protein [Bacteroidales bacterium]
MRAKHLISDIVPSLRTSDTGMRALNWMEIFRVSHLPIVNNKEFLGLISDTDIYDLNMADEPIGNHSLSLFRPYVSSEQHIFEVIETVSKLQLTVVPVLDENKNYMGLVTLMDLINYFADMSAFKNPGGIIVLELNVNDYSLSEIAQIIEGNDTKILSLYITQPNNSTKLDVTIKVNRTDITSIVQTFNRYDYTIKASFMDDKETDSFYNRRFDEFMRYLSI